MSEENIYYVYVYLDNRKPGEWFYKDLIFNHQPFYIGKGKNRRMEEHLKLCERRNHYMKTIIINKIYEELEEEPIHYKIYENLSFEEAHEIEIDIITPKSRREITPSGPNHGHQMPHY